TAIINDPLNAPHSLLAYGLHTIGIGWRAAIRLSSTFFGVLFIFCFYFFLKNWFGKAIGIMGTLLLAANPLFLVMARDGAPTIMLLSIIVIMATYVWATRSDDNSISLIILMLTLSLSLYTPGIFLWALGAAIICRKKITALFQEGSPPIVTAAILISLLALVPLGLAIVKDINLIKQLLIIPHVLPPPIRILKNIVWMASALFIKTPHHVPLIMGQLPLFNIVSDALLAFGIFAMWVVARLKLLIFALSVTYAIVIAGVNDNIDLLALAIPAISVIIAAGLRYLFIEWRRVFPRNPLAKNLAFCLMWAVVIVQLLFGLRYAALAWPVTTDTRNTYVLK
ncbi:glycosyltransferase family 39 protein, partial [Candidatus Saccharibacteria bacterium]|nr:glycosyltransferase family 39 protein [Candidatus Saccharibacteria bacterium]